MCESRLKCEKDISASLEYKILLEKKEDMVLRIDDVRGMATLRLLLLHMVCTLYIATVSCYGMYSCIRYAGRIGS